MKINFKEITLEVWECNHGKKHVRLDNVLSNQYINILSTNDHKQAEDLFNGLHDVLLKYKEK